MGVVFKNMNKVKPKRLNERVGVDFYNKLMTHPVYQDNWKAISGAFYFLNRVSLTNKKSNWEYAEFQSENIKIIFHPYFKKGECDYVKFIDALVELELLRKDPSYLSASFDHSGNGRCMGYVVTDEGIDLIYDCNKEFLKKLHTDKKTKDKNTRSIRDRKVMTKEHGDYLLNYIHAGLINSNFNYDAVSEMIDKADWEPLTKQAAITQLTNFKEKKFMALKYNDTTGRVYNDFATLKSELRQHFTQDGMRRIATIDIRACHPTYFAAYLVDYAIANTHEQGISAEYVLWFSENNPEKIGGVQFVGKDDLNKEYGKWVDLFTAVIDPREIIGKYTTLTLTEVKTALTETMNGSTKHKKVLGWMSTEFPNLYKVWRTTDVKQTGNYISRVYESKIMLNQELYRLTESLEVNLMYEYDGVSVFSKEDRPDMHKILSCLTERIRGISRKSCGITCVLKTVIL